MSANADIKDSYHLDFTRIGMIALCFQLTASVLQPLIGCYTDKRPLPWSLPFFLPDVDEKRA